MKEKAKKEKRYLCDRLSKFLKLHSRLIRWTIIILCILSCIIAYKVITTKYAYQLDLYSEDDYQYLSEVAESFWDEDNKTLSLVKKPKDVNVSFDESYNSELKIILTKDSDYFFASWPTVYVEISKDFDKYTIRPLTKEGFLLRTKITMIIISIFLGLGFVIVLYLIIGLIGFMTYIISLIHKKIIKRKKPNYS